jgi:hypothetical protein
LAVALEKMRLDFMGVIAGRGLIASIRCAPTPLWLSAKREQQTQMKYWGPSNFGYSKPLDFNSWLFVIL